MSLSKVLWMSNQWLTYLPKKIQFTDLTRLNNFNLEKFI